MADDEGDAEAEAIAEALKVSVFEADPEEYYPQEEQSLPPESVGVNGPPDTGALSQVKTTPQLIVRPKKCGIGILCFLFVAGNFNNNVAWFFSKAIFWI